MKKILLCFLSVVLHAVAFAGINDELLDACKKGDIRSVRMALGKGADPNYINPQGIGPALSIAFFYPDILECLVKEGKANVNQVTANGSRPIGVPIYWNLYSSVKKLIELGADVKYVDQLGYNSIQAAFLGYANTDILTLLADNGASVSQVSAQGCPFQVLLFSCNTPEWSAYAFETNGKMQISTYGNVDFGKWMLTQKADNFNSIAEKIAFLRDRGVDIKASFPPPTEEQTEKNIQPALEHLKNMGYKESYVNDMKKKMMKGGAKLTYTPVGLAAYWGKPAAIEALVNIFGADVNEPDGRGYDALIECLEGAMMGIKNNKLKFNYEDAVTFIIAEKKKKNSAFDINDYCLTKPDLTPLFIAARTGNPEVLKKMIALGANVNKTGYLNISPLYIATEYHKTHAVDMLLQNGADPSIKRTEDKRDVSTDPNSITVWTWTEYKTPMELAKDRKFEDIVALLKKY